MTLIAHHPHGRDREGDEASYGLAVLRALLTIVMVTVVVGAAFAGITFVIARIVVGLLP